jgi:hypothetical protein
VELVTLPGVPIVRTGTYDLSSGTTTFSEEDIASAVEAFANDPAIKAPRIKIASLEKALGLDPNDHGGEPAFGWADNLTASVNGQELLADLHVPQWIADAMEYAYPALSIEGTPPGWISATGRQYDLVITAVALLGVHWPGITTLDDFREILAGGPPLAEAENAVVIAAAAPRLRTASLDADIVVRRFIDALDTDGLSLPDEIDNAWDVWPRTMRFDDTGKPYLKVTDEASGVLYRVDIMVTGSEVTFGEFVEVVEQDVAVAAMAHRPAPVVMAWSSRDEVRASSPSTTSTEESSDMTDDQRIALAKALGLSETASETDIHAESVRRAAEGEATVEEVAETVEGTVEETELVAASGRTVSVSAEVWEQTQRDAREGALARTAQVAAERDGIVSAAVADGRITPAERDDWRKDLDDAPEVTARTLARLTQKYPGGTAAAGLNGSSVKEGQSLAKARSAMGITRKQED